MLEEAQATKGDILATRGQLVSPRPLPLSPLLDAKGRLADTEDAHAFGLCRSRNDQHEPFLPRLDVITEAELRACFRVSV